MTKKEIEKLKKLQELTNEIFVSCGMQGVEIPKSVGDEIDEILISLMGKKEWEKAY